MTSAAWDVVWMRVSGYLADVVSAAAKAHPGAWSVVGRIGSDVFPFGATASFGRGDASTGVEDVVVSVSGQVHGETLRMSADVSRGDGYVLLDGPTAVVPMRDAEPDLEKRLEIWLIDVHAFLREATGCVVDELSAR